MLDTFPISEMGRLLQRFPKIELSYETISHKKVSNKYNICLAVPTGKKAYIWFTFHQDKDVCYFFDLNKERKISKATTITVEFENKLALVATGGSAPRRALYTDHDTVETPFKCFLAMTARSPFSCSANAPAMPARCAT
jgi:hypothetical protein